jgi:glycosyltransferase involved in cell wall biosynthesis
MRIVIATPIYPPEIGGPATYTHELASRLSRAEQITTVAYADEGEAVAGTKLVLVAKKQDLISRLVEFFFVLLREARKANVIYVQNAVAAGLPAVLAGMLLKKPVVLKFVGDEAWERATQAGKTNKNLEEFLAEPEGGFKTSVFIFIQKFVLTHVSAVVPPSQFLGEILSTYYGVPAEKLNVNYNAVEEYSDPKQTRIPYQISVACRLVTWKHVDGIIRAIKIIQNTFPDVQLVIAGEGPESKNLKKLTQELGIERSVTFLGRISQAQARDLQAASAIHVLNSTYEGLPYEVLNAFRVGTPVVATDIPGTREAVINEKTGLLVPPGDEATLAVAIERLFIDQKLGAQLAAGGLEILKTKFSWNQHTQTLLAIFASLNQN